jgi:5-methylcytosine-specific restriction endonuclease McrA
MNIYGGMKRRTEEKRFKSGRNEGRIRKHGIELPFKAADLERWLLGRRGSADKPFQCHYCSRWITLMICAIDHKIPTGKGGSAGFENLDDVCSECNELKGEMVPESFELLLAFLRDLGIKYPLCAANIHNRLVKAVAAIKEAGRMRAKFMAKENHISPAVRAADQIPEVDNNF